MSIVSRATSKSRFETGDLPTQQHFEDLHDSALWNEDLEANSVLTKNNAGLVTEVIIGASRILGRKSSGEIIALTPAEIWEIIGFVPLGDQDISSTISWTGTTPPSSLAAARHNGIQIGKKFFGQMRLEYDVAGAALTALSVNFPANWPAPAAISEWDNSEMGFSACGYLTTNIGGTPVASRCWIEKTGAGTVRVTVTAASAAYIGAIIDVSYITV